MTSKKLWALVKWIGGEDDKKFTSGIPIEWIKGFDIDEFRSDKSDPTLSYVIEWHDKGKKQPPGGWPVYDGYVIEVSNRINVLEKRVQMLDGLTSPTKVIGSDADEQKATDESGTPNSNPFHDTQDMCHTNHSTSVSPGKISKKINLAKVQKSRIHNDQIASGSNSKTPNDSGVLPPNAKRPNHQPQQTDDSGDEVSTDGDAVMSGIVPIDKKNARARLYKTDCKRGGNGGLERTLRGIQDELKRLRKKRSSRNRENDTSDSSQDEMKEIGPRGSGVFISEVQWQIAKTARTYSAMGINLPVSMFPMDLLLRSNLRGGKSKITVENGVRRPALDTKIVDALYYTVRRNFKTTFNNVGLGIAINNKLSQLRIAQKNRPEIPDTEQ